MDTNLKTMVAGALMTMAISGASMSVMADDSFSRQRSISDGSPYPEAHDRAADSKTVSNASPSPEVAWALQQLTISDGSPVPVGTRGDYIAPPRFAAGAGFVAGPEGFAGISGTAGVRRNSRLSAQDRFFERQRRISDGSVD